MRSGLRPLPVIKAPDKIVERSAFVPSFERCNLELLEYIEGNEYAELDLLRHQRDENFAISSRHAREKRIDLVLIGQEFGSGILIPYARAHAPSPNLTLTIVADINQTVDQVSVYLRLHCDFQLSMARSRWPPFPDPRDATIGRTQELSQHFLPHVVIGTW